LQDFRPSNTGMARGSALSFEQSLLRRSLFFSSVVLVSLGLACSVVSSDPSASSFAAPPAEKSGEGDLPTLGPPPPAATAGDGSALVDVCGTSTDCSPDDDGSQKLTSGASGCERVPPDAGDAPVKGCRLHATSETTLESSCGTATLRAGDGARCSKGADCAPGYDCVEDEKGSVCRRYCCSGSCSKHYSHNGGPTFCDLRKLADVKSPYAPMCMPIKDCTLLDPAGCEPTETCAVVDAKGSTGCVPRGPMRESESCDQNHCEVDLTCLGSPGERRCYKLCRTTRQGTCPSGRTCTTGAIFVDSTYGVCK
jgi:hypothetical protein